MSRIAGGAERPDIAARRRVVVAALVILVAVVAGLTGGSSQAAPVPSISINDVSQVEGNSGNTNFVFTVTLSSPSTKTVKVDYQTVNGTATLGSDFNPSQGSLSFDPGQTSATIIVTVRGDTIYESDETFFVNLSNPRFATIADGQGVGTIVNDDQPVPGLSINDVTVAEGNSGTTPATFTVTLSSPATSNVTFDIATADGTATAPGDYTAKSVTGATIPAGQQTYSFTVDVVGDTTVEPNETFLVNMTSISGATAADAQGVGTIVNDDTTGGGGLPSLSISDPSAPEGNIGTTPFLFTVTLSAPSQQQVKVNYATADGTASALSDYQPTNGQLIFKKGETSKTITVFVFGDTIPEPDETFLVNLSNPVNATLAHGQAVATIQNDDNQPPTSAGQSQTTLEDTPLLLTLSGSDPEGASLTFHIASGPAHGSLGSLGAPSCSGVPSNCTATVTYTPGADYNGPDSFTFTTNDGSSDSAPATVSLSITAVNDAPSFTKGTDQSVLENSGAQTVTGWATNISAGAANESGQTLTFHVSNDNTGLFSSQPAVSADGTLTFTPATDAIGSATVDVYLTDDGGTANGGVDTSATQSFTINVVLVNHAPSFSLPTSSDQTVLEDVGAQTVAGFASSISPGPANEAGQTVTLHTSNDNQSLFSAQPSIDSTTGNLTYTPAANANGSATVSVYATDDGGTANGGQDTSATQTFQISVTAVNDAPSFSLPASPDQSVINDQGAQTVSGFATNISAGPPDEAGQTLTFHVSADDATLFTAQPSIDPSSGDLTYTPSTSGDGTTTVHVFLSDNGGTANSGVDTSSTQTFQITVTPPNRPPAADDQSVSTNEDTPKTITLSGGDADGDPLSFSIVDGPQHGSLGSIGTVSCSGNPSSCSADVQYTPNANYNGSDSFTFKTNDGHIDSTTNGTVSITVNAVDDPPVAVHDSATVLEDASATTIDVLANDTDIDGGPKTITSKTNGANGATVTITNAGADLTYQPAANFCGPDSFTYTLNGGSSATVDVDVTCVNDAPSFTKGADQTSKPNQDANGNGISYTVPGWATNIAAGPANESGQTLTFHVSNDNNALFTTQPAVDPSTGDLTFTTDPTQTGSATVSVYLSDDGGTTNGGSDTSATQTFMISTVFPPPVAVDDNYTATGNVRINVNTVSEGVLERGTDDKLFGGSLHGFGASAPTADGTVPNGSNAVTTSNGGTVVLAADGTFTYDPPPGYTGNTDGFYYDLHNSGGDAVGHVTITIGDMVWFVDNSAASAGDGRLDHPFNTLAAFQAVNDGTGTHPATNQPIFLYSGSGAYTGGVTLLNGQKLFGQAATADLATLTGITLAPFSDPFPSTSGTAPTLTSSGITVQLGSGNTVRGLKLGDATSSALFGFGFGTLTLSETDIVNTQGSALRLQTGTANATLGTLTGKGVPGTPAVSYDGVAGTTTVTTGGALSDGSGAALFIVNGSAGFSYPGTITSSSSSSAAVTIQNNTGGTIALSGQITDTTAFGPGVVMTGNAAAVMVDFTGGVSLSTGANTAFAATGGGAVTVTGSTNTLATTTGKALDVENTTIGSSGLTFRSISSNGATSGIVLNATGSSGGLTVTGTGTSGSGGTIQNSTTDGVVLTSTTSPNLSWLNITDSAGGATDDGLQMTNVSGTVTIANSTITNAPHNGFVVDNNNTNMTAFNLSNTTIQCQGGSNACAPTGSTGNDALLVQIRGTSVLTGGSVTNSTFSGVRATGVQVVTNDSARIGAASGGAIVTSFTVSGSTFANNNVGLDFSQSQVSNMAFQILTNTITGSHSHAMNTFTAAGSDTGPTSHFHIGKIDGNLIGTQGTKDSGSVIGDGIRAVIQGQSTQGSVTISNNVIREVVNADVISLVGQDGNATTTSATAKFKVVNNMMPAPSGSNQSFCGPANTPCALSGIFVLADEDMPVCNVITGNTIYDVTTMNGANDVYLAERSGPPSGAQLTVEGTGGSNSAYIQANNTLAGATPFLDEALNTSQVPPGTCGTFP